MEYILNDKQKEACFHQDGPLLILAGAGSGKTRVITHRIAYLMDECGVNPYNILAITFTNKAANEMRERVDSMIGFGSESVWISTFHSMCVRILRKHAEKIGYSSNFTIYDTDDQKAFIKECLKYLNMDPKNYSDKDMISAISKAKEAYMTPDDYERVNATSFRAQQVASLYREYQKRLKANNAFDFDDLIMKTIYLFEIEPMVLDEYQERFKYIMVDEYQDTNHTQFLIVKQLAAKYRNLCVVGDDDQSIYKFRGANIENILNFKQEYKDAFVVKLEQNYRSTGNILNAANAVVANNEHRTDKALWTDKPDGPKITFTLYEDSSKEASSIASKIRSLWKLRTPLSNIAILYRTNAQSRLLEEKLIFENVPYVVHGSTSFYQRREIRDLIAYLKAIYNSADDTSMKRIINVPKRGIGDTTVGKVAVFAYDNDMSLYDALLDIEEIPGMSRNVEKISHFTRFIEDYKTRFNSDEFLSEVFEDMVEQSGYLEELKKEGSVEYQARKENIDELANKIRAYEEEVEMPTLGGLLEDIALVAEHGDDDSVERCTLMTLHAAKGLEFQNVFITGMEEGLFPSQRSMDSTDSDDLEEERRLCYVGITRAEEKLYLSASKLRMRNGQTIYAQVSRFIDEIPKNYLEFEGLPLLGEESESSDRDYYGFGGGYSSGGFGGYSSYSNNFAKSPKKDKTPLTNSFNPGFGKAFPMGNAASEAFNAAKSEEGFEVGDKVRHIKFGVGEVIDINKTANDTEITVEFERENIGTKTMYLSLVKMKKL